MKIKQLLLFCILFLVGIFCLLIRDIKYDDQFNLAKREILVRKIGHEILLHASDSTSRVLPVMKLPGEKYRLQFGDEFTFDTDILVGIVRKTLAGTSETSDYIVTVLDCSNTKVIFGYAISDRDKKEVIPCSGRKQISDCYLVDVDFGNPSFGIKKYAAAASLLAVFALCPFVVLRRKKLVPSPPLKNTSKKISIGAIAFDAATKQLQTSKGVINLTGKEARLLAIFANQPNEVIDRGRLQKEIWEDDGVIVGRSLDVFISKLRKKLESDAAVQLINIHGKGYKLQIEAGAV